MDETSDTVLLERWRAGDTQAGEALFARYYHMIERFFLNKLSAGVEDLVQETFMACLEGRDRVREGGRFRSYVFAIACNVLRGHLRGKYKRQGELDFDDVSVHDLAPGPSTMMAVRHVNRVMLEGLRRIPLDYQMLLELYYWEQLQTPEIAEVLDMPVSSVRRRLARARELLADAMTDLEGAGQRLKDTASELEDWARQCREALIRKD